MIWSGAGDCRRGRRLTVALLYLLGRMPEEIEEAYEIHLLECRSCLVHAQAVEQALRFRVCFQGEIRDMRDLRRTADGATEPSRPTPTGSRPDAVVIPFQAAKMGLWNAQREWIESIPLRNLANQLVEELALVEGDLKSVETALNSGEFEGGEN